MKNDKFLAAMKSSGLYKVTRSGTILTCKPRGGPRQRTQVWRPCTIAAGGQGRLQVRYRNNILIYAARLIWFWFKGPIPSDMQVDHINNDVQDNRLANLQLLSPKENTRKAERDGLYKTSRYSSPARKAAMKKFWNQPGRRKLMSQSAKRGWLKRRNNNAT